jgi:hypothetical protein
MPGFREQLRNNTLALVSLAVALSALGYTTWRNQRTEQNRNVREAGFHLLGEVASLQQLVLYAHFTQGDAAALRTAWEASAAGLNSRDEDFQAVDDAIDKLRQTTLTALRELD